MGERRLVVAELVGVEGEPQPGLQDAGVGVAQSPLRVRQERFRQGAPAGRAGGVARSAARHGTARASYARSITCPGVPPIDCPVAGTPLVIPQGGHRTLE